MKSNFTGNGSLENIMGFVLKDQTLKGVINASVDKMNLNEWMGEEDTTTVSSEVSPPFQVPANIAFTINANVDKVHYDKTDISNLSGRLNLRNETVDMQNVTGNALGEVELSFGSAVEVQVGNRRLHQQPEINRFAADFHMCDGYINDRMIRHTIRILYLHFYIRIPNRLRKIFR